MIRPGAASRDTASRYLADYAGLGRGLWRDRGRRALAAVASPRALSEPGRMVGELLLAPDEVGSFPW